MTSADIIIIVLQSLCVVINGIVSGIHFNNDRAGLGFLYLGIAILWIVCIILRLVAKL